jgi:adenylosuccinate synthase
VGEKIRQAGREFGSTTGRPRRCGWIDLPSLRYSIMLNGVTELHLMKADVLDDFTEIQVCTHYMTPDGQHTDLLPDHEALQLLTPVYTTLPGWNTDLQSISDVDALPLELRSYVQFLESHLEVPIRIVSVGPDRVSTIHLN